MTAGPRVRTPLRGGGAWRSWGLVLLALAVAAGVLAMHGASPGHHPSVDSTAHHAVAGQTPQDAQPAEALGGPCPASTCQGHGALGAMCLFFLQWLLLLLPGRADSPWRWRPRWPTSLISRPPPGSGLLPRVSLIRLCISRT